MKLIEITDIPEKVALASLAEEVRAESVDAIVLLREEHNTISPEGIRKSTPAAVVVEVPDDTDPDAIKAIVAKHKPDKSDEEAQLEKRAAQLFDVLQHDPRMAALLKLAGGK